VNFYAYIRKTTRGGYYVVIPAAFAKAMMKDRGLADLDGEEVKVEVTL